MAYSPIVLFVYNRPEHTKKTVETLKKNFLAEESELVVFSDGAKEHSKSQVEEVRNYIKTITGFKKVSVHESDINKGLANSIISGVTEIVNTSGKVIVVEDDLVTSPYFLTYMNEALDMYQNEERVASIHGYTYPVKKTLPETFFLRGADCWGWATWKRSWDLFEFDGKNLLQELTAKNLLSLFDFDGAFNYSGMLRRQIAGQNNSWAIRWHACMFLLNKLTLYPGISLVENIGQDSSGTHKGDSRLHNVNVAERKIIVGSVLVKETEEARKIFIEYFKSLKPTILQKILFRLKKWL